MSRSSYLRASAPPVEARGEPRHPPADRLYVHLAWTTLGRLPLVGLQRRAAAESHLLALCRWLGAEPVEACVLSDRVHLLVRFRPGQTLTDLVRRLQQGSEGLLATAGHPVRWSRRYAAVTVSPADVRRVRRRIARRAEQASEEARDPDGATGESRSRGAAPGRAGARSRVDGRGDPV